MKTKKKEYRYFTCCPNCDTELDGREADPVQVDGFTELARGLLKQRELVDDLVEELEPVQALVSDDSVSVEDFIEKLEAFSMNLMNLPLTQAPPRRSQKLHYKAGHRDARHAAVQAILDFIDDFRQKTSQKPKKGPFSEIGNDKKYPALYTFDYFPHLLEGEE